MAEKKTMKLAIRENNNEEISKKEKPYLKKENDHKSHIKLKNQS